MTLAADPLAPQRDLSVTELRSGYGYGSGVSYVGGVPNPAGVRSGVITVCTTLAQLKTAVTNAGYGDDIVVQSGSANAIITDGTPILFPVLPAITAATPRQAPPPMMDYSSGAGLAIAAPKPMSAAPPALTAPNVPVAALATVTPQGDPSYVRIMSGQAELVTTPPPHTTWHVTQYERMAHLVQGNAATLVLSTPDTWTHYDHHHFRMEGLRLVNLPGFAAGNAAGAYLCIGSNNAQVTNTGALRAPDHFIFDRCYLDGAAQGTGVVAGGYGSNRGVAGGCDYFGLLNCRVAGNYVVGGGSYNLESNAVSFSQGVGPTHIENNWLTGAGECILMNANPAVGYPPPYIQSDCTFTRNWAIRPLTWRESFHYNAVAPNQVPGGSTVTLDAPGTTGTISNAVTDINHDVYQPGDLFWTATTGRPVSIGTLNADGQTFTLVSAYTENAGTAGNRGIFARGRQIIAGGDATTVTLSGAGNRTVSSSSGTTVWLTTIKPYVDTPPPGAGMFFGVNRNTTSAFELGTTNDQKFWPVLVPIASVDSDTQLTLAADYTAGTWTGEYFSVTPWDGIPRSVMKNLHEWKGSNRIRILGNVFENTWETFNGQGPNAWALNIAATGTFSYHHDEYYGYNLVLVAGLLHYFTAYPYNTGGPPQDPSLLPAQRCCLEHNLFVDVANRKWISDYSQAPGINQVYQVFHPISSAGVGGSGSAHDYQIRHNDVILSTDSSYETAAQFMAIQLDSAADPQQVLPRFTVRDNVGHVGSHAVSRGGQTGGFVGGSDTDDFDNALLGTAAGSGGPPVSADSIVAHNLFLRNSAVPIAAHGTQFGSNVSGFINEASAAFTNYGNASNTPYWLTQSVVPSDYALTAVYQTDAAACTVSGKTVTVSSGTIPNTVGLGTPFRIVGDPALVLQRVASRDSATQVTLSAPYEGHTGAGLTGVFSFVGAASDGTSSTVFVSNAGAATVTNITSVSYTESFTHADESTLTGIDQPWTQTAGSAFGISANAAQVQAVAFQIAVCQTSLRTASHTASAVLSVFSGGTAQGGVCVNAAADGSSMYVFTAHNGLGAMELWKWVSSVKTSLATGGSAAVAGDGVHLEYNETTHTLTGSVNGTPIITFPDPSPIASNNFAGIAGGRSGGGDAVSLDTFAAQTTGTLNAALVTLTSGTYPSYVAPSGHGLFPRTFVVVSDAASNATAVASYDSATQIALASTYPGTTGAGLTGVITGIVPTGADPGVNTTVLASYIGNIRT